MTHWRDVPGGRLVGAQQRFWHALGSDAGRVIDAVNTEEGFVERLAEFAKKGRVEASKFSSSATGNGGITYATGIDTEAFLRDWAKFYIEIYSIAADLSQVPLPPITSDFGWGVVVLPGLTPQQVFDKSKELFPSWKNADGSLDQAIDLTKDERTTVYGAYVVWCRDRVEADEELKNTSADQIKERGITTMTLLERELLEQWYYWKSGGDHLDKESATLCTGSRYVVGDVPSAGWNGSRGFCVGWYFVYSSHDDVRARQVVSLPATPAV